MDNSFDTEMLKCKSWVTDTIQDVKKDLHVVHKRIDNIEDTSADHKRVLIKVEDKLEEAEAQREQFNNYMASEVRDLKETVARLSANDNERHTELINHITDLSGYVTELAKKTDDNSSYITEAEIKEQKEKYAEEQIKKVLAPRVKLWNHVKLTAAGLITLAVLTVLGKLAWMAINIDELITKAATEQFIKGDFHGNENRKNGTQMVNN